MYKLQEILEGLLEASDSPNQNLLTAQVFRLAAKTLELGLPTYINFSPVHKVYKIVIEEEDFLLQYYIDLPKTSIGNALFLYTISEIIRLIEKGYYND